MNSKEIHLLFFSLNNQVVEEAFNHYENIMVQFRGNEVINKVVALAEWGGFSLTHKLFSLGMSFAEACSIWEFDIKLLFDQITRWKLCSCSHICLRCNFSRPTYCSGDPTLLWQKYDGFWTCSFFSYETLCSCLIKRWKKILIILNSW